MRFHKFATLISILIFPLIFSACADYTTDTAPEILRLHIRANGNGTKDQAVKLLCRDAVTAYLEAELANVTDAETAKKEVKSRLKKLEELCNAVLKREGLSYKSSATVSNQYFPAKTYGNITLPSGYYDAVVITLGEGKGENWWCVVYPPLCYLEAKSEGGDGFKYKSKIAELFEKYFKN